MVVLFWFFPKTNTLEFDFQEAGESASTIKVKTATHRRNSCAPAPANIYTKTIVTPMAIMAFIVIVLGTEKPQMAYINEI